MPVTETRKTRHLALGVAALALASALPVATAATASAADPDFEFTLDPGVACDFALHAEGTGDKRILREFKDEDGNLVRILTAGKGFDLTFTNVGTGKTFDLASNGSVQRTTINADGTTTVENTGHNVLILFPTDVPAGPSTTLYVGLLVYTVDANGVFTLQSTSGPTTDICALLT